MNKLAQSAYKTNTCDTCPLKQACPVGRFGKRRCAIGRNVLPTMYLCSVGTLALIVELAF